MTSSAPSAPERKDAQPEDRSAADEAAAGAADAAAFFDLDNTVMRGATVFHLARGLYRRKFFSTRQLVGAAYKQAYFRIAGIEDPRHVAEARAHALEFIKGHAVCELVALGEEIFEEAMADRIWPGTQALAQQHIERGERVWLVTAAPDRDRDDHRAAGWG